MLLLRRCPCRGRQAGRQAGSQAGRQAGRPTIERWTWISFQLSIAVVCARNTMYTHMPYGLDEHVLLDMDCISIFDCRFGSELDTVLDTVLARHYPFSIAQWLAKP